MSFQKLNQISLEPITAWVPTRPHVNTCFYSVNGLSFMMEKEDFLALSPYDNFVYTLKPFKKK